jgi:uncharacterized protein (TIGR03083 family)
MSQGASASIDHLSETWRSIDALCSGLSAAEWDTATGCPGWTVRDNISHLIDYESGALGRARPDHTPSTTFPHVRNPLGEGNEIGVDARRGRSGPEVLDEFRDVMADRLAQLRDLGPDDFEREVMTPAGTGTVADMLTLRVMDTWSHEQDIRRAVGHPGHESGGAVSETVEYFARFLPLVVGKRVGPPDGTSVVVAVGDLRCPIVVESGRARPAEDLDGEPTATITMSAVTFTALVGGRSDAPDDALVEGDTDLGRAVIAHLGFMP